MNTKREAVIIGGGIAGTVAAMALRKAGCEATVYEAYGRSADGLGSWLTLAVNGIDALGAIGIDGTALGGFETPQMAMKLGVSGELLTTFDNGPRLPSGVVSRSVRRADLYSGLRDEAVRRGVGFEFGKRLVDASRGPDGRVTAHFEDGTTASGDLLLGADGLRSKVRTLIDPAAPQARYLGLLNAGGYARGVRTETPVGTLEFVFGRRGFFGFVPMPNGEIWWFANPQRAREPSRDELAAITPEAWRAELLALFEGDRAPATEIIRASPEIFAGWPTYDFPSVPRWHRDGMLIIGDAAHAASPSSGQGASMAIEDGVAIARCVRDAATVDEAFARYEAERRPRVERVVKQGKRNGTGKAPGPIGRVFRDFAMGMFFRSGKVNPASSLDWLYKHSMAW